MTTKLRMSVNTIGIVRLASSANTPACWNGAMRRVVDIANSSAHIRSIASLAMSAQEVISAVPAAVQGYVAFATYVNTMEHAERNVGTARKDKQTGLAWVFNAVAQKILTVNMVKHVGITSVEAMTRNSTATMSSTMIQTD
jgi:hypothetical protein